MRKPPKPVLLYGAGAAPLLNASTSTLAPLTAGMPKLSAAWPERKLTMPTLNVSCAEAAPMASRAARATAPRRHTVRAEELFNFMRCLLWFLGGTAAVAAATKVLRGGRGLATATDAVFTPAGGSARNTSRLRLPERQPLWRPHRSDRLRPIRDPQLDHVPVASTEASGAQACVPGKASGDGRP